MRYVGHPVRLLPGIALLLVCALFLPASSVFVSGTLPTGTVVEILLALVGGGATFFVLVLSLRFLRRALDILRGRLSFCLERWFRTSPLVPQWRYVGVGTDEERTQFEEAFEEIFDAGHSSRFSQKLGHATEHLKDEGHSRIRLYTEFNRVRFALWVCCLFGAVLSFLTGYTRIAAAYRSLTPGGGFSGFVALSILTLVLGVHRARNDDSQLQISRTNLTYVTEISLLLTILASLFWRSPSIVRWYEPVVFAVLWSNATGVTLSFVLSCFLVEYVGAVYHNRRVRTVVRTLPAYAK